MTDIQPTLDGFFAGREQARALFEMVRVELEALGPTEVRVSKSQVGFYRKHPFAATWKPRQYLSGKHPPLVLSIYLKRRDSSPRWKEIVEPTKGRFTHHVELWSNRDVDNFVTSRLEEAWGEAA